MEDEDDQQKKPKARVKPGEEEDAAERATAKSLQVPSRQREKRSGGSEGGPDAVHVIASNHSSSSVADAATKGDPKTKDSSTAKLPAAMLDPESLEKRRADNRRHAAASRKRNRETQDRLIGQANALEKQVFEEKQTNLLLRQRMLNAWQTQQTLLQANGVAPIPIPAILGTAPPSLERTGPSPRDLPGYPSRRRRRMDNRSSSEEEDEKRGTDEE